MNHFLQFVFSNCSKIFYKLNLIFMSLYSRQSTISIFQFMNSQVFIGGRGDSGKQVEWDSCCAKCLVKFQNREKGIEFCKSRKIIKLVFIQGKVRLRHFQGRALRPRVRLSYDTFWAERCGHISYIKDPNSCQSLRRHPTDIIFLEIQN